MHFLRVAAEGSYVPKSFLWRLVDESHAVNRRVIVKHAIIVPSVSKYTKISLKMFPNIFERSEKCLFIGAISSLFLKIQKDVTKYSGGWGKPYPILDMEHILCLYFMS